MKTLLAIDDWIEENPLKGNLSEKIIWAEFVNSYNAFLLLQMETRMILPIDKEGRILEKGDEGYDEAEAQVLFTNAVQKWEDDWEYWDFNNGPGVSCR